MKHFLFILLVFFSFSNVEACDCPKSPNPLNEKTLESGAYEFFLGTIEKVEKKKEGKISYYEYTFKVDKKYTLKDAIKKVSIRSRTNKYQVSFDIGSTYLISAERDGDKNRWTNICHFKRELKSAKRYIEFLDERYP